MQPISRLGCTGFVALMIVWLAPFAGVWLVDGVLRRWHYDPAAAHATAREQHSIYWGWNGIKLRGFAALAAGIIACLLTINAPIYQGPVSRLLDGADLTWVLGFIVSGLTYYALARGDVAQQIAVKLPRAATESEEVR